MSTPTPRRRARSGSARRDSSSSPTSRVLYAARPDRDSLLSRLSVSGAKGSPRTRRRGDDPETGGVHPPSRTVPRPTSSTVANRTHSSSRSSRPRASAPLIEADVEGPRHDPDSTPSAARRYATPCSASSAPCAGARPRRRLLVVTRTSTAALPRPPRRYRGQRPGHNHPAVVSAVSKQAGEALHVSNFYHTGPDRGSPSACFALAQAPEGRRSSSPNSGTGVDRGCDQTGAPHRPAQARRAEGRFHGPAAPERSPSPTRPPTGTLRATPPGSRSCHRDDIDALRAAVDESPTAPLSSEPIQGEAGCDRSTAYLDRHGDHARRGALLSWTRSRPASAAPGAGSTFQRRRHRARRDDLGQRTRRRRPDRSPGDLRPRPVGSAPASTARPSAATCWPAATARSPRDDRDDGLFAPPRRWVSTAGRVLALATLSSTMSAGRVCCAIALTAPVSAIVATARDAGFIVNPVAPDAIRIAPPHQPHDRRIDLFVDALPGLLDAAKGVRMTTVRHLPRRRPQPGRAARHPRQGRPDQGPPVRTGPRRGRGRRLIFDKQTLQDPGLLRRPPSPSSAASPHDRRRQPRQDRRESPSPTSRRVLGREAVAIVWRTHGQERIEDGRVCRGAGGQRSVRRLPPRQILADLLTIQERRGRFRRPHPRLCRRWGQQHGALLSARWGHRRDARADRHPGIPTEAPRSSPAPSRSRPSRGLDHHHRRPDRRRPRCGRGRDRHLGVDGTGGELDTRKGEASPLRSSR